ncbi:hypothetical protein [Nonomuraea dietziae]|uniref:hypothetical protein n=1 Tax=Nonomuraea dietziae TaxID=65515 RepID=UPI0033F46719
MIGGIGRVLDVSALVDFATQRTRYMEAVVWTHDRHVGSLLIPAPVLAAAIAQIPDRAVPVLEVLVGLEVTTVVALTEGSAPAIGATLKAAGTAAAEAVTAASVVHAALTRGIPVVTGQPYPLLALHPSVEIDLLP